MHWTKNPKIREKIREKIRNKLKGKSTWNKGLTKEDPRVAKNIEGHSEKMKLAWAEGKYQNRKPTRYINFSKNQKGELNPNWKGTKADTFKWKNNKGDYVKLHKEIRKLKGNPQKCEFCGATKNLNWANKSHQYKNDLMDWISLCAKCHSEYDKIAV